MHPVSQLIAERRSAGSAPDLRSDPYRLAVVIEGGTSRGCYSSGMVLALEELGLLNCFDAVYGSSAGALNGAWLLCRRAVTGMRTWWNPQVMRQVLNPLHPLRGRPVVDTNFLVHRVYSGLEPMDFPAILDSPVTFHPLATDADTGESTDLLPYLRDVPSLKSALRATAAVPILAGRPVPLAGRRFLDAGLAEPLPVRTALAQGATHLLVLRTRRADEPPSRPPWLQQVVVPRYLSRRAPGALRVWRAQYEHDLADEELLRTHEATLTVRPPLGGPDVPSLERDPELLRRAVRLGRDAVRTALTEAA